MDTRCTSTPVTGAGNIARSNSYVMHPPSEPATCVVGKPRTACLLQGLNEWRNIQDIVRLTFKAFHDVLRAQGDAIKTLERVVDTKANHREVKTALAATVSASELEGRLHDLEAQLFRKADAAVCPHYPSAYHLSSSHLGRLGWPCVQLRVGAHGLACVRAGHHPKHVPRAPTHTAYQRTTTAQTQPTHCVPHTGREQARAQVRRGATP